MTINSSKMKTIKFDALEHLNRTTSNHFDELFCNKPCFLSADEICMGKFDTLIFMSKIQKIIKAFYLISNLLKVFITVYNYVLGTT